MSYETVLILAEILFAALILNLPFGYLRVRTRKFSIPWFVYIHLPIPFIFVLRTLAGFGYQVIPVIIVAAIAGQIIGGRLNPQRVS